MPKARLDGALGSLCWQEVSLPMAGGWNRMVLKVPFSSSLSLILIWRKRHKVTRYIRMCLQWISIPWYHISLQTVQISICLFIIKITIILMNTDQYKTPAIFLLILFYYLFCKPNWWAHFDLALSLWVSLAKWQFLNQEGNQVTFLALQDLYHCSSFKVIRVTNNEEEKTFPELVCP